MKIKQDENYYFLICRGCNQEHLIPKIGKPGASWTFNGDFEKPTFSPSVMLKWNQGEAQVPQCCHFIITDGNINYCGDCTHALVGQTIPLPEIE